MSYTALYRKFRPQKFEDVRGQDHIVTTLRNQIKAERIGHAYLFCGTRGTGKTTIAKILAKAVNCEHPVDGNPCGECPTCRSIAAGTSMNVVEIDAASNNGVDNIRQLREEVAYSPTEGRYKVYIIDEVHMLSTGAFNALLKTLEEPPSYVVFILATTESHKIPITILSRCQRYDFRRISIDTISARLMELMETEQVEVEEKAIRYVAKAADGSMRDALSLLDQCIAFYLGKKLTYDNVLEVLGAVDTEIFSRLLRSVIGEDVSGVIRLLEELVIEGRELKQFVNDFTWYLRNILLIKGCDEGGMEEILDVSGENLVMLEEDARLIEAEVLMRYIRIFSELSDQIKYSSQKRILIEIALIKLCKPSMESTQDSLADRIARLEQRMEQGIPTAVLPAEKTDTAGKTAVSEQSPPAALPEDVQQVMREWKSIIQNMSGSVKTYLKQARLSFDGDNRLLILFDDPTAVGFMGSEEHRKEIEEMLSERTNRAIEVAVRSDRPSRPPEEENVDLNQIIREDIEIED